MHLTGFPTDSGFLRVSQCISQVQLTAGAKCCIKHPGFSDLHKTRIKLVRAAVETSRHDHRAIGQTVNTAATGLAIGQIESLQSNGSQCLKTLGSKNDIVTRPAYNRVATLHADEERFAAV